MHLWEQWGKAEAVGLQHRHRMQELDLLQALLVNQAKEVAMVAGALLRGTWRRP